MPDNLHIAPITLEEMDSIKLMNRTDTKYLTDEATLAGVLGDAAAQGFRALLVAGTQVIPYYSVYFDTPDLKMYLDHHNRRLNRHKVRTREYVGTGNSFLEIKRKHNTGRTKKKRTPIPVGEMMDFSGDEAACSYLESHCPFTVGDLSPVLSTGFDRITLVNPDKTERITIDSHLEFNNFRTGRKASLLNAVVIEIKQDGRCASPMKRILLDRRVKPVRISKYCIAETLTDPGAKSGRFKEKVRAIEKTINKKLTTI